MTDSLTTEEASVEYRLSASKTDTRFTIEDANRIGSSLRKLDLAAGTEASATEIVNAARDQSSPLHRYFDWDDQTASEKYRRMVAKVLRSRVLIIVRDETRMPRTVIAKIRTETPHTLPASVSTQPSTTMTRVEEARKALTVICDRFRDLTELDPVRKLVEKLES